LNKAARYTVVLSFDSFLEKMNGRRRWNRSIHSFILI
jgi:hypothetical protein